MAIEQGKLGRLNDTDINASNLADGKSLVYNATTGKWEPKEVLGGGTGPLGMPTDGTFDDGAVEFQPTDMVVDAIDDLNEVLGELVPANALPITNIGLNTNNAKVTAKVAKTIAGNNWTDVEGTQISNVSNVKAHKVTLANTTTAFANADKGVLKLFINDQEMAKIDLGANFDEAARKSNQNVGAYNTTGNGDAITAGTVTFTNGAYAGTFKVVSVGKYNNFSKWQKGVVEVNLTAVEEGKNTYKIVHVVSPTSTLNTATHTFYYDANTVAPSLDGAATIAEKSCVGKYISGVKYYTTGDTFDVDYTVSNAFKTVYHNSKVSEYSMPGINVVTKNPATTPVSGDQLVVSEVATINAANVLSNASSLNVKVNTPYKSAAVNSTVAENRLVSTFGNVSTKTSEVFKDEQYRLPLSFNFDSKTDALTGNWASQDALTNGNALIYFAGSTPALVYPNKDFSTGILPAQTANYSTFTGNQVYVRSFEGANKGSATFTLAGLSNLSDVKIEIKLPGMSGWGNALSPYDSAANKSQDGWGMLQGSASKTSFTATFGGLNTADTNGRIYVRITLLNQNATLQGISVGW